MSRLGKQPITFPRSVSVEYADGTLSVTGPKGTLSRRLDDPRVTIQISENEITLGVKNENDSETRAFWGTYAAHIKNMIHGVTEGFQKVLEIEGVGYRAEVQGTTLTVNVGYSHPVTFTLPEGVGVSVEKNVIKIEGIDTEKVGQFAANVRAVRPPEPYKGKGIHYEGEYIIRKQGKKAV